LGAAPAATTCCPRGASDAAARGCCRARTLGCAPGGVHRGLSAGDVLHAPVDADERGTRDVTGLRWGVALNSIESLKAIAQSGLPNCVLPKACASQPNLSRQPDDTGAFTEQFHAAKEGAAGWGSRSLDRGNIQIVHCVRCIQIPGRSGRSGRI